VYLGGAFTVINQWTSAEWRSYLAEVDATTGIVTSWDPAPDSSVLALAISGSTLYSGGAFTMVNTGGTPTARKYLAAFDRSTGTATAWDPSAGSMVYTLATDGSTVYAGGFFQSVGSGPTATTRRFLAAFDAATGAATAWDPNPDLFAWALALSGDRIYAGGYFTGMGGVKRNYLAALGPGGAPTAWDPDPSGPVTALALSGNILYAGGMFTTVNTAATPTARNNLAAFDTATGTATAWRPGMDGIPLSLKTNGGTVYAGGMFTSVWTGASPTVTRNSLAAFDMATGEVTAFDPNVNGPGLIWSLAISGNTVYSGGTFTMVNTGPSATPRNNLAAFDAATGAATAWDPDVNGMVMDLVLSGGTVYTGGSFTSVNASATARNGLAAFDAATGAATAWDPDVSGSVSAVAFSGTTLYAGGSFTSVNAGTEPKARNGLAAFDAATGAASAWDPDVTGASLSLAVLSDRVYAVGGIASVGGEPWKGFARIKR
jgi:hypothetical protein